MDAPLGTHPPAPVVILVVDDEPDIEALVAQKFRRRIRAGDLTVHFAHDGDEALKKLAETPAIEMVVTDINMPNMDGLTLVSEMRERHPLVKAIIVSAYGDLDNIRSAMNRGAFDFLTKPLDFDDFERTVTKTIDHVRAIQTTIRSLEENRILKLFVDEGALHFMLHQDMTQPTSSEMIDCSVAFIDICAFTALSERHEPDSVVGLLNQYFDAIVEHVLPEGGALDKFIGDAAMVVFRGEGHELRAVRACLAVRASIQSMRREMETRLGFFPNVAIGLNSGRAMMGLVGAKRVGRLDFTVIGDVVNTAARLQGNAGPGEIVVSAAFAEALGEQLVVSDRGVRSIKGKALPIHLYSIDGLKT